MEVSRCSSAKQRQRNVQKKCAARAKLLFLLIRSIVVFHRSRALPSPLSITRFYILFEQTIKIISESFAFSPGKIYTLTLNVVLIKEKTFIPHKYDYEFFVLIKQNNVRNKL